MKKPNDLIGKIILNKYFKNRIKPEKLLRISSIFSIVIFISVIVLGFNLYMAVNEIFFVGLAKDEMKIFYYTKKFSSGFIALVFLMLHTKMFFITFHNDNIFCLIYPFRKAIVNIPFEQIKNINFIQTYGLIKTVSIEYNENDSSKHIKFSPNRYALRIFDKLSSKIKSRKK